MTPSSRDRARLDALAETRLLDQPASELLDRYVRIAQAALEAPVALVSLVDDHRQFFTSQCGLGEPWASRRETPLSHSFCQHVVADEQPLVVEDARTDPRVAGNLAIVDLSVIAYAGMPIRTPDGHVLGSFCAIDTRPRAWSKRDLAVLAEMTAAVSAEIDLRRRVVRAEQSERGLVDVIDSMEMRRQEVERSAQQTTHDLRTPLQVVVMAADALAAHAATLTYPELARLAERLRRNARHASALVTELHDAGILSVATPAQTDLVAVATAACADLQPRDRQLALRVEPDDRPPMVVAASAAELRRCIDNLVTNAQRFAARRVEIHLGERGPLAVVTVEDDGPGLPTPAAYHQAWQSRTRFHELAGKSGSGLGLSIVRSIVEELGGAVVSGPSGLGGASFGFEIPLAPAAALV